MDACGPRRRCLGTSTDAALVKEGTQVSRCACRRECIAGAAAQEFSGSEAGRQACVAAVRLAQSRMARPSQLDHCMLKIRWSKQKEDHRSMKALDTGIERLTLVLSA